MGDAGSDIGNIADQFNTLIPMGLDTKKLKEVGAELEKRTQGSSKGWFNAKSIDGTADIRIMDPVPEMEGVYFIEVPVWWVNKQKFISPKFLGEECPIERAVEEAKAEKDPDVLALLKAKEGTMPKVDFSYEYWMPILLLEWEFDGDTIVGIYDGDDYDPALIDKYIVDGRVKMFQAGISLVKAINTIATARNNGLMTDPVKGFNITCSKTGKGRETKYAALKAENMPMPQKYYDDMVSPMDIVKSLMHTNEYMDSVIGNYLWGEDKLEEEFRFPDIREELTARFKDDGDDSPKPKGKRPSKASEAESEQQETSNEEPAAEASSGRASRGSTGRASRGSTGRGAAQQEAPKRGRRDIVKDLKDVEDE